MQLSPALPGNRLDSAGVDAEPAAVSRVHSVLADTARFLCRHFELQGVTRAFDTSLSWAASSSSIGVATEAAQCADGAQSPPVSSAPVAAPVPSSAGEALPSDMHTVVDRLTMHQLKSLLSSRSLSTIGSKRELVARVLLAQISKAEVERHDPALRPRRTRGQSSKHAAWSDAHRNLYSRAAALPDAESMLKEVASALQPQNGLPPFTCSRCGARLELMQQMGEVAILCPVRGPSDGCGHQIGLLGAYRMMDDRRTIVMELVHETAFRVYVHRDLQGVLLPRLAAAARPLPMKPHGSVFTLADSVPVLEALTQQSSTSLLELRVRRISQTSQLALQRAREFDALSSRHEQELRKLARARLEAAGLLRCLRDHQVRFIEWALQRRRVLCADDMGLGKTLQSLALLVALDALPALVICPAFARSSWAAQIEQWGVARPGEYRVIRGSSSALSNVTAATERIVVVSYAMLQRQFQPIRRRSWKGFIVDESHRIGTSKKSEDLDAVSDRPAGTYSFAAETAATIKLLVESPREVPIVLLSGTPGWAGSFDVFNQAQLLSPGTLGLNKWHFARDFFKVRRVPIPWRVGGYSLEIGACERPEELNLVLTRTVMLRRRRHEVLAELPELQLVELPLGLRQEHAALVVERFGIARPASELATSAVSGAERSSHQAAFEAARGRSRYAIPWEGIATPWERTGLCKVYAAKEVLKEKLTACMQAGEAVVLFVRHHRVRETLEQFLEVDFPKLRTVSLYGQQRESGLKLFAAGARDVAVCMVESCGVAIDLSIASVCIFLELPSTASEFSQAVARLHRQGQRSAVTAFVILCECRLEPGTRDEKGGNLLSEIISESQLDDRKRWFRLLRSQAESARLLGDGGGSEEDCRRAVMVTSAASQSTSDPERSRQGHELTSAHICWHFVISAETQRLHVFGGSGLHAGLISRAAPVPGVPLLSGDFVASGARASPDLHDAAATASLPSAANDFVSAHAALSVVDRHLLWSGRQDNKPVPCSAGEIADVLRSLRKRQTSSKRRFAGAASTQQASHAGKEWMRVFVSSRYGDLNYRQRVDVTRRAAFCLECLGELTAGARLELVANVCSRGADAAGAGQAADLASAFPERWISRCSVLSDLFCEGRCQETYFVKRRGGAARSALFALEGGVCRACSLDTERLRKRLALSSALSDVERHFMSRLSHLRRSRLESHPGSLSLWELDHVRAVVDGGGEAGLSNLQTLCLACHAEKTRREARHRAQERRKKLHDDDEQPQDELLLEGVQEVSKRAVLSVCAKGTQRSGVERRAVKRRRKSITPTAVPAERADPEQGSNVNSNDDAGDADFDRRLQRVAESLRHACQPEVGNVVSGGADASSQLLAAVLETLACSATDSLEVVCEVGCERARRHALLEACFRAAESC